MRSLLRSVIAWLNKPAVVNDDPNNVVQLAGYAVGFEAEELVELLKHVGIQAAVFGLQVERIKNVNEGLRVMVRTEDLDRARIVLADFEEELVKRRSR